MQLFKPLCIVDGRNATCELADLGRTKANLQRFLDALLDAHLFNLLGKR